MALPSLVDHVDLDAHLLLAAQPFEGLQHVDGRVVLTHTRLWGVRDRYVLELFDPATDSRLAIALAVCLDAMQKR